MMAKKKISKKVSNKKKVDSEGNKWNLASASSDEEVRELLNEDYEPFAVSDGSIYFKKKGN